MSPAEPSDPFRAQYRTFAREAGAALARAFEYVEDALQFQCGFVRAGGVPADLPMWDVVKLRPLLKYDAEWLRAAFGSAEDGPSQPRARPPAPIAGALPPHAVPREVEGVEMEAPVPVVAPRRWYVAWHPSAPYAILRSKDAVHLRAWRMRKWDTFPGAPVIVDVTEAVGRVLATLTQPNGDTKGAFPYAESVEAVLVLREDGPDVELRGRDAPALDGEVASLTFDLRECWSDLAGHGMSLGWGYRVLSPRHRIAPAARP